MSLFQDPDLNLFAIVYDNRNKMALTTLPAGLYVSNPSWCSFACHVIDTSSPTRRPLRRVGLNCIIDTQWSVNSNRYSMDSLSEENSSIEKYATIFIRCFFWQRTRASRSCLARRGEVCAVTCLRRVLKSLKNQNMQHSVSKSPCDTWERGKR